MQILTVHLTVSKNEKQMPRKANRDSFAMQLMTPKITLAKFLHALRMDKNFTFLKVLSHSVKFFIFVCR